MLRLEILDIRSRGGKAKVLGTLMGIGGAMVMTFYKGVEIHLWTTHVDLLHRSQHPHLEASTTHEYAHRILGCLLALASSLGYALWLIIQVIDLCMIFIHILETKIQMNYLFS